MGAFQRPFRAGAFAFLFALVVLAQGINAPFVKDAETQSAQWVQSVANGRILIPVDYYGQMDRKPPLFYWLAGAITTATGGRAGEVNSRAVSLFAAAAVSVEVLFWSAAEMGAASGWLAFFILLGTYGFASRATLALTDMLMTLWIFTVWCMLYPKLEDEDASRWRTPIAGLLLGLGVLTKGPVAIVLCAMAAALWLLFRKGSRAFGTLKRGWPWAILAIALLAGACWYVPAAIAGGRHFFQIFVKENYGHFLPRAMGGTGEAARPIYYIALRMFGGMMPISFLLPALLVGIWSNAFDERRRRPVLYQLTFALTVLIFFSVASAKRDDYILPALPSLAIGFAAMFTTLTRAPERGGARWAARLRDVAVAGTVAVMAAGIFAAWLLERLGARLDLAHLGLRASSDRFTARFFLELARNFNASFAMVFAAAIVALAFLWIGHRRRNASLFGAALATMSLAGVLLFTAALRPEADLRSTLEFAARDVMRIVGNQPLYIVAGRNYELSYYCGREIPPLFSGRGGVAAAPEKPPLYVFAYKGEFSGIDKRWRERLMPVAAYHVIAGPGQQPTLYMLMPEMRMPMHGMHMMMPGTQDEPMPRMHGGLKPAPMHAK